MAWVVKVTEEYAAWFTALIKQDLGWATQVAQAVAALREEGPTLGRPLVDRLKATRSTSGRGAAGIEGTVGDQDHLRLRPHPVSAAAPGRRQGGNWTRWYRDNIPLAEQLYIDYTADEEE